MAHPKHQVIQCNLHPESKDQINLYADELKTAAYSIGSHGLTPQEFDDSGLFYAAVERIRGQRAASMKTKYTFLEEVFSFLKSIGKIKSWKHTGGRERHDFQVVLNDDRVSIIEAKGCLDGNNTTISIRPPNADEFIIWSLCQNPGSDLKTGVWSAVHTRIGGDIVAEGKQVDGLVILDMLCGGPGRPCPKLTNTPERETVLPSGRRIPPPCLYLFPRTVPDARNNPNPPTWQLNEIGLLQVIYDAFGCDGNDVTQVQIEARMNGVDTQRKTTLVRNTKSLGESNWADLKRATK